MGWLRRILLGVSILVAIGAAVGVATKPSVPVAAVLAGAVVLAGLFSDPFKKAVGTWFERPRTERALTRLRDARGRIQLVRDCPDPIALGVHRAAIAGDGTVHTGLPPYVRRDAEAALDKAFRAGGLVIVQGPSAAGKSRLAFETMHRLAPQRRLIVPGKETEWYTKADPTSATSSNGQAAWRRPNTGLGAPPRTAIPTPCSTSASTSPKPTAWRKPNAGTGKRPTPATPPP